LPKKEAAPGALKTGGRPAEQFIKKQGNFTLKRELCQQKAEQKKFVKKKPILALLSQNPAKATKLIHSCSTGQN